jgi:hypothetical protein
MRQEHFSLGNDLSKVFVMDMQHKKNDHMYRQHKKIDRVVDQNKSKLVADLKRRKGREAKANYIVQFIQDIGDETDAFVQLCCKKCHTSHDSSYFFGVPTSKKTIKWSLLWESPTTVKKRKDLQDLLGNHWKLMSPSYFSDLCSWKNTDVETCMILLCHAFHCPGVQCGFIPGMDTWSSDDHEKYFQLEELEQKKLLTTGNENEDVPVEPIVWGGTISTEQKVTLGKSIKTLLIICYKTKHYGVMKISPAQHLVQVWDADAESVYDVEYYWKVHAIRALKMHFLETVQEDELNILTSTELRGIEKRNNGKHTPFVKGDNCTWRVEGMWSPASYKQSDIYSCGPIAINRFASELRTMYHALEHVEQPVDINADLLDKIKSPDELKDNNSRNAAELFEFLLNTKRDAFLIVEKGVDDLIDSKIFIDNFPPLELQDDKITEGQSHRTTPEDKTVVENHFGMDSGDIETHEDPNPPLTERITMDSEVSDEAGKNISRSSTPRARPPPTRDKNMEGESNAITQVDKIVVENHSIMVSEEVEIHEDPILPMKETISTDSEVPDDEAGKNIPRARRPLTKAKLTEGPSRGSLMEDESEEENHPITDFEVFESHEDPNIPSEERISTDTEVPDEARKNISRSSTTRARRPQTIDQTVASKKRKMVSSQSKKRKRSWEKQLFLARSRVVLERDVDCTKSTWN